MSFFQKTSIDTKAATATFIIFTALLTRMTFALETYKNPTSLIGRACTIYGVGDVAAAVTFVVALCEINFTGYYFRKPSE